MIIHTTLSCTYFPCLLVGSITQVSALKHPHSVHLPTIGWASNKSPSEMSSPFWFGKPKATHDALMIIHSILPAHIPCLLAGSGTQVCAPRHPTYCVFLLLVGPPTKPTENLVCLEFLVQLATCSMHAGRKASSLKHKSKLSSVKLCYVWPTL